MPEITRRENWKRKGKRKQIKERMSRKSES
jgi:hypothetical protein